MQTRTNSFLLISTNAILLPYLNEASKLTLAAISKAQRQAMQAAIMCPFVSKSEFTIATSGYFTHKPFYSAAWKNYQLAYQPQVAYLYKMREPGTVGMLHTMVTAEVNWENTGKLYQPGIYHTWPVNQLWVLGHLHARNDFIVFSKLKSEYIWRNGAVEYSAFVKELSLAVKAGYRISIDMYNRVRLNPPVNFSRYQTLQDCSLTEGEIQHAVRLIQDAEDSQWVALEGVQMFLDEIREIERMDVNKLSQAKAHLLVGLDELLSNIMLVSKDKKVALEALVTQLNVGLGSQISLPFNGPQLFDYGKIFLIVKQKILATCAQYMDQLIDKKEQAKRSCCTLM